MKATNFISTLPRPIKIFLIAFIAVLSVGYFTGLSFVRQTDSTTPQGVSENYNGNEQVEGAEIMKFKKSKREILTIIHTHILSLSLVFLILGVLVWGTNQPQRLKTFLTVEPFVSIVLTFGGIYMLWLGYIFFKYIVVFSGLLMTISYCIGVWVVLKDLIKR